MYSSQKNKHSMEVDGTLLKDCNQYVIEPLLDEIWD